MNSSKKDQPEVFISESDLMMRSLRMERPPVLYAHSWLESDQELVAGDLLEEYKLHRLESEEAEEVCSQLIRISTGDGRDMAIGAIELLNHLYLERSDSPLTMRKRRGFFSRRGTLAPHQNHLNIRDAVHEKCQLFDGESGLIFPPYPADKTALADDYLMLLKVYLRRYVPEHAIYSQIIGDALTVLRLSSDFRQSTLAEIQQSGEQKELTVKMVLDTTKKRVDSARTDGKSKVITPITLISQADFLPFDKTEEEQVNIYNSRLSEGLFEDLDAMERFREIMRIFPKPSAFRDKAFSEQIDDVRGLSMSNRLRLRDAYHDVRFAEEVAEQLCEEIRSEGQGAAFREAMVRNSAGKELAASLQIESVHGAARWKQELFDILCFYPRPSYFRDELLTGLTNMPLRSGEGYDQVPGTAADMKIISQWYVDNGALRKDPEAGKRKLEMELLISGIRTLNRAERIDALMVIMGIEIENDTKRKIESAIRRKVPNFDLGSSRITKREQEQLLLELFEGNISGIFTPPNEQDSTAPDRLLKELSQNIVREGSEETRVRLANLVYRLIEKCHWQKRLRIVHEIVKINQGSTLTLPEFVTELVSALGPHFIRGGQQEGQKAWMPREYRDALINVYDNNAVPPKDEMMRVIDRDVGLGHFKYIGPPIASGSIAVVYQAVLQDDTEVALKVVKPTAVVEARNDYELITYLLGFVKANRDLYPVSIPESLGDEIHESVLTQLKLSVELSKRDAYAKAVDALAKPLSLQDFPARVVGAIQRPFLESAKRIACYELVRGVPLTREPVMESFAEWMGYTLEEFRARVCETLAVVQVGSLLKAEHMQVDPNLGNALIGVEVDERRAPKGLAEKVSRSIAAILNGDEAEELTLRESRHLTTQLHLLDFGSVEQVPQIYREQLQHLFWAIVTGNVECIRDLLLEFHLTTWLPRVGGDVQQVPKLNLSILAEELVDYFEKQFGESVRRLVEEVNEEEYSRERFEEILKSLAQGHDFASIFQDLVEIIDRHNIFLPSDLMSILRSFRIGSYIFENLDPSRAFDSLEAIIPKGTQEEVKDKGRSILRSIVPEKVRSLVKKGIRSLAPLKAAFVEGEEPGSSWISVLMKRIKDSELDKIFEEYKPGEREHRFVSEDQLNAYKYQLEEGTAVEAQTLSGTEEYEIKISKIAEELKIDRLDPGVVIRNSKMTIMTLETGYISPHNGNIKVKCLKEDGSTAYFRVDVILKRSKIFIAGRWLRGIDLVKVHKPGEELSREILDRVNDIPEAIPEPLQLARDYMEQNTHAKGSLGDDLKDELRKAMGF